VLMHDILQISSENRANKDEEKKNCKKVQKIYVGIDSLYNISLQEQQLTNCNFQILLEGLRFSCFNTIHLDHKNHKRVMISIRQTTACCHLRLIAGLNAKLVRTFGRGPIELGG